jgi:hypothetical protein
MMKNTQGNANGKEGIMPHNNISSLQDGSLFGDFSRFCLRWVPTEREFLHSLGIKGFWCVFDAETPDEVTGQPAMIRQSETKEEALRNLS